MEASHSIYDFVKSRERIDEILAGADASYDDQKGIPPRTSLTFSNGFYVQVTVMFIDLRGSKQLPDKHTRPVLAKIYRSYISETVAVLQNDKNIHEVYIEGDGVWAVFNTPYKVDVEGVIHTSGKVRSLIDVLNIKYAKRGYSKIKVGIGIENGESLYIKAGYKGSSINEVVWIGRSVGGAAQLCSYGNKAWGDRTTMISEQVYSNLSDKIKSLFEYHYTRGCYQADIVDVGMNEWVTANG